jgi:hypothetical protein
MEQPKEKQWVVY